MSDSIDEQRRTTELKESFRDQDVREGYAEGFLNTWIASQLTAIRLNRGLTQKELAEAIGTKQPGVARMERENYGKWNLQTLARAAAKLGCRLKVSLETYGTLVEEAAAFRSPGFLLRPDFAHDPFFAPSFGGWPGLDSPGPVGYMRRQMFEWVQKGAPLVQLRDWLAGRDLPAVGDDQPPSYWLIEALRGCPAEEDDVITSRLRELIPFVGEGDGLDEPDRELLEVIEKRARPSRYQAPLQKTFSAVSAARGWHDEGIHPLLSSLAKNQNNDECESLWLNCIRYGTLRDPSSSVDASLLGLALIPNWPNDLEVLKGLVVMDQELDRLGKGYSDFVADRLIHLQEISGYGAFLPSLRRRAFSENLRERNLIGLQRAMRRTRSVDPDQNADKAEYWIIKKLDAWAA